AYGNNQFVAVGWNYLSYPGVFLTSPDGVNWMLRGFSITSWRLNGVAYGNNEFVAVGQGGSGDSGILTSPDGNSWNDRVRLPDDIQNIGLLQAIAYGSNQFVAVGWAGAVLSSADGFNWIRRSSETRGDLYGITYGNNLFVAVGGLGTL